VIPRFDIDISIDVDFSKVIQPPWRMIREENGLMANHDYVLLRGVTWKIFKEAFNLESKALELVDSKATTHGEFEKLADDLLFEDEWQGLELPSFLDLGIASTVLSLYAFKCFPITSCRGHLKGHGGERHPLVAFFPQPDLAPIIVGVAAGTGVGICNECVDEGWGLMVYGQSIIEMRSFALGLQRAYPATRRTKNAQRKSERIKTKCQAKRS